MTYPQRPAGRILLALATPLTAAGLLIGAGPAAPQAAAAPAAPAVRAGHGTPAAAACRKWSGVKPPSPGAMSSDLFGVTALSRRSAWAVGDDSSGGVFRTLAERWNGKRWTHVSSPSQGRGSNYLTAVAATSPSSVWAVGGYATQGGGILPNRTLILHWNGHAWRRQATPSPGRQFDELNAVHVVSAKNVWAVGVYASTPGHDKTLILHWNGKKWTHVPSPSPGTGNNDLNGVTATGRTNAWAVGLSSGGLSSRSLILRWNGRSWKQVSNKAGKSELLAVAATSARSAWAVGDDSTGRSLVLRWNGRRWARVASPNIEKKGNDNLLSGVAATSSRNAWAVGTGTIAFGDGARGFVLHWNGRKWTRMTSPSPSASVTHLDAVAASSAGNAWAVGTFAPDTAKDQTKTYALHCR